MLLLGVARAEQQLYSEVSLGRARVKASLPRDISYTANKETINTEKSDCLLLGLRGWSKILYVLVIAVCDHPSVFLCCRI